MNVESKTGISTIGLEIREIRTKKGVSIDQLSALTGIDLERLQCIENTGTYPSFRELFDIADGLGVVSSSIYKDDPFRDVYEDMKKRYAIETIRSFDSLITSLGPNALFDYLLSKQSLIEHAKERVLGI